MRGTTWLAINRRTDISVAIRAFYASRIWSQWQCNYGACTIMKKRFIKYVEGKIDDIRKALQKRTYVVFPLQLAARRSLHQVCIPQLLGVGEKLKKQNIRENSNRNVKKL